MRSLIRVVAVLLFPATLFAQQLTVREIRYDAALSDNEARFIVDLDLEAAGKGESALTLFDGEVAVLTTKLPANLRLVREGNRYQVVASRAGRYKFKLDLVAKIIRQEPWNRVTFTGPEAAIASVAAQASGAGVEVQLQSGTLQEATTREGVTRVRGFLGPERQVAVRWQSKAAEVARKALLTCETTASVQVTPTVVKYNTTLWYEILQGSAARLVLTLPATQALTKLQGEGVRDWQVKPDGGQQTLTVEFIKPVEKAYVLTLLSEQTLETAAATALVAPPQPQEVERETGSLTVAAEDVLVETETATGLRQVNASAGALAAYQFYARPFTLALKLRRIEPVVNTSDRVTVRLEESRLLVGHTLTLTVEKAGIYSLELLPPAGFVVGDVRGMGIEDWRATAGKLLVTFNSRVLGSRQLDVQLEQALKKMPEKIEVKALRVTVATRETAQIGAASVPGLQLKTAADALTGVREMPVNRLASRSDEALAYNAEQADWRLTLAVERLAARITADVFNLVTIGDGLLGGSATIRYAIINQGVQEFRVKLPGHWKNVEFTGPNIRRKELQDDVWIIGLQEKAWGGYTLVVTYDYGFDPHKAAFVIGGIHCENVEHETGNIAITSAANLQIQEANGTASAPANGQAPATTLYRIDEVELAGNDRALVTRPVLMAYRYAGQDYALTLNVTRFEELPVLDAAADRTQLTTVLTDAGQMLTQASFMVKNNDRQFQTFTLPAGADFWACYVGGEPIKPEKNGNKLLVPLPRRVNRDEAFAVDIVYVQKIAALKSLLPRRLALAAPETDMQTTYAEWELYIPQTHRLSGFGGNMIVARGTTYGLHDAWLEFTRFYDMLYRTAKPLTFGFAVCLVIAAVVVTAIRRGWRGFLAMLTVLTIVVLLAGMLLPALSSSREKSRRAQSMSNLRQIGLGIAQFSQDRGGQMPETLDEIKGFVGSDKVFMDVETGARFDYIGAGRKWQEGGGDEIVAYSQLTGAGGHVLFNDGHVEWVRPDRFGELLSQTMNANGSPMVKNSGGFNFVAGQLGVPQEPASGVIGGAGRFVTVNGDVVSNGTLLSSGLTVGNASAASSNNLLVVTGSGTMMMGGTNSYAGNTVRRPVHGKGVYLIGDEEKRDLMVLRDNGAIYNAGTISNNTYQLGMQTSMGNQLIVTNGGQLFVSNFSGNGSSNNTLTIAGNTTWNLGGQTVTVGNGTATGNVLYFGGSGVADGIVANRVVLSNSAALSANSLSQQGGGADGWQGNGSLQIQNTAGTPISPLVSATVSGIRPIRIDIPKTGQRFVFTKVLNVRGEPLSVRALAMEQDVFKTVRGSLQTVAFVVGLVVTWWQWQRAQPKSLVLTVGLALTLGAVVSLLISWRALHVVMILVVPVVSFAICVMLVRRFWKTSRRVKATTVLPPPIPPVVTAMLVLLLATSVVRAETSGNAVSILSANYTGTVRALDAKEASRAGQFEAVIALTSTSDNQTIRLFGEEVAVQEFTASPATVKLVRDGKTVSVFIPRKGAVTVRLKFLVKTTGDVARRQVLFGIPAALASRVNVTLDEPEAQVEAPTAVSFKVTPAGQQTQLEAVLGSGERVELNWTPRMKRAADVATTLFCQSATLVNFGGGGGAKVHAMVDFQVTQGELRQMRVAIPAGQRLLQVEGDGIRTWKMDGQVLSVELVKGVTPSYRLGIDTVAAPWSTATIPVEIPYALDVKRETGLVAVQAAEELNLTVTELQDLQKVDLEEWMQVIWPGSVSDRPMSSRNEFCRAAYRFLKPDFKLTVRVEPEQPQIEAVVRNHARVTTEQIGLLAVVDYTIKRAGVFTLRLALPKGYRVERVTGQKIAQWVEKSGTLDVTLKERTTGGYNLSVELVKPLKELTKSLAIVGVQPLDVQKLSGFVSVSAEEGVQIKTETFDGISEVPATLVAGTPAGGSVLGFKLIPSDAGAVAAGWKLAVATEKIESWVRAEVMNTVTLSETLVSGRSVIRYDVANAPTKEFRVRVPAAFRNVEVTGANIRRKDHDEPTGEWRVELQTKVRGLYELTVTWDMPWDVKSGALELVGVEAPGVERETGSLAIIAPSRLRVETKSLTSDLSRIDARDLPEWATRGGGEMPVLAYKYLRPGFKLGLTTQRFDEAQVLQALVDSVRLTTVVSEDGQMMTEMALAVRNNARQYLEITLPPGTTNVWSAFVAGQPVRPSVRAGKLLLPMERSGGDATVAVEVTYVGWSRFPRTRGGVELVSPALDVPLKNARWELYLPPDYRYGHFEGSMKYDLGIADSAGKVAQVVRTYSLGDYVQTEQRKKAETRAEEVSSLSNARANLEGGKFNEAWQLFSRAKQSQGRRMIRDDQDEAKNLKQLEGQLKRVQAWNVGQNSALNLNAGGQMIAPGSMQVGQVAAPQQQALVMNFDEVAAEKQWEKVQAAQEITVAQAMPLRVNLPKRGVRLAFSQVLQTEISKPMSVQFSAVNERVTGWPSRIVMGAVGFLVLWGAVVAAAWRRRN